MHKINIPKHAAPRNIQGVATELLECMRVDCTHYAKHFLSLLLSFFFFLSNLGSQSSLNRRKAQNKAFKF